MGFTLIAELRSIMTASIIGSCESTFLDCNIDLREKITKLCTVMKSSDNLDSPTEYLWVRAIYKEQNMFANFDLHAMQTQAKPVSISILEGLKYDPAPEFHPLVFQSSLD